MDKKQLLLERNAESVKNLILFRRLFAEIATMQERAWIREQERIAQLELKIVRAQAPDTGINPDVIEIASGIQFNSGRHSLIGAGIGSRT